MNFWTSFTILGDLISVMARTLSRLMLSLTFETTYPKNFLELTPKMHFSGFGFNPTCHMLSKVSWRSC